MHRCVTDVLPVMEISEPLSEGLDVSYAASNRQQIQSDLAAEGSRSQGKSANGGEQIALGRKRKCGVHTLGVVGLAGLPERNVAVRRPTQ